VACGRGQGGKVGPSERALEFLRSERSVPALTHLRLVLVARPPDELELRYDRVKRHDPSPAGSITLVPAGSPV
jgi:hypothetical protein